jgi:uncharacterized Zn finger protein
MKKFILKCERCSSDNCEIFTGEDELIHVICNDCGNFEEDVEFS